LRFSGEVAWVTGSSKGIGRAVSIGLAEQGCDVVVHYNSSEDDAREVQERIQAVGRDVLLLEGDVTHTEDVRRMVREIEDHYGRIDILVNNAGSMVERTTLAEMPEDVWDRVMDVNLKSVYLLFAGRAAHHAAAGQREDSKHDVRLRQRRRQPQLTRLLDGQRRR
jgi:3-oxoacyl-[acyl-carrier protein] reductase